MAKELHKGRFAMSSNAPPNDNVKQYVATPLTKAIKMRSTFASSAA